VESPTAAIVFCRTRTEVDQLSETLNGRGYRAEPLHGGMSQEQRDRVMNRVRNGTAELLIATDVAARGLDIDVLTHVVNYDVPSAPESYVHRIGRVGRAGRDGVAITLAEPREHRLIKNIEHATGRPLPIEKLPSVADLQARRMELTQSALRDVIVDGGLDRFRAVVEALGDEFDLMEIALGAVRFAHESSGAAADDTEIPDVSVRPDRKPSKSRDNAERAPRPAPGKDNRQERPPSEGMGRVFVGAGRAAGVRPQDLVGAIAGETSLQGRDIGAIQIADRFALVEVPSDRVDEVVHSLRATLVRGKKVTVRRDKGPSKRA
jgi:ATP-dependent RNA helicase DeaD